MLRRIIYSRMLVHVMLAFALAWFGMILPGHQRGIVKLPCTAAEVGKDGKAACPMCAAKQQGELPAKLPGDPVRSCALCFLVAGLNLPPEAVVVDLRSWLLDELQFIERESLVASIDTITFHLGRAPPAA